MSEIIDKLTQDPSMTAPNQRPEEAPEILVERKTLYHGSGTPSISELQQAEETSVGKGVYFVDNPEQAAGYARRRAKDGSKTPVVYEVEVENLCLVNLKNHQKLQEIMRGFRPLLEKALAEPSEWWRERTIQNAIKAIDSEVQVGKVKYVAGGNGEQFTNYLKSLGYDGLVTLEGGEGNDVGNHDTYLIFDPAKTRVVEEQPVQ